MRKLMLSIALALPFVALAANPNPPPQAGQPSPEQRQEMRRKIRALRQEEMIVRLGLSDADAARVKAALDKVNQKRDAVQQEIRANALIVRDAARGDPAAQGKVDAAIGRLFDARAQMLALDRELFNEVSRGLDPQKKAKLAIALARAHMGGKGGRFGHGGRGAGPGMGPGMGPGGPGFGPGGGPDQGAGPDEW